jgi:hypothetical protein
MKKHITGILLLVGMITQAQIGIGTITPNSTLDVRGALSLNFRVFTGTSTAISSTDNTIIFTGTLASTATMPDATTCIGRIYRIKNASITIPVPGVTIATTAAQTIDGISSWVLDETYESITIVSNGTNWLISSQSLPNSSGSAWIQGGNSVSAAKNLGTISNYDLPFITNNTEKMRLSASGSLGIGTSTFDPIYPEKLLVNAGITSSFNLIEGHGKINSYLQFNIQNDSSGTVSSSDMIATSNNGNEVKYYVDLGINSSGNTQNFFGGANDAYLYSQGDTAVANTTGGNLYIGTSLPSRDVAFLTGGGTKSSGVTMNNERMRILSTGNVGINTNTPTEKLDVIGNLKFSGALMPGGSAGTAGFILQSMGAGTAPVWLDASSMGWLLDGNTVGEVETIGTKDAFDLPFITNNTERMRITSTGSVGIGAASFNGTYPERLLVNADTPSTAGFYQNVIVGKGNTNSYAQLNIQNTNVGTAASSDVVATADIGNEVTNFIDMGINSSINSANYFGGLNDAYLYAIGNGINGGGDLFIGTATPSRDIAFLTGGGTQSSGVTMNNERMRILGTGNVGISTNAPNSNLDVNGSVGYAITTTTTNLTLNATHYTVIVTGSTPTITLPAASTCARRIYIIVDQTGSNITLSGSYKNLDGSTTSSIGGGNAITIQSNGTSWYRIQ